MVDLYADFAYARLTTAVSVGATQISVDTTARMPTNDVLAKGEFWVTLDTPTPEVVQLVSVVDATTLQISAASKAQDAGYYVKGSWTAAMARRSRSAFYRFDTIDQLPTYDADLYEDGDAAFVRADKSLYALDGGVWVRVDAEPGYRRYVDLGNAHFAGTGGASVALAIDAGLRSAGLSGAAAASAVPAYLTGLNGASAGLATGVGAFTIAVAVTDTYTDQYGASY